MSANERNLALAVAAVLLWLYFRRDEGGGGTEEVTVSVTDEFGNPIQDSTRQNLKV